LLTGHKRRLQNTFKRFDNFFEQVVREHLAPERNNEGEKDILDVLLEIQKNGSSEMPLTLDNVKAILMVRR